MCFTVVSAVSRYVAESPVRAPIRFVFDEQQGVDVDVEMFFSEMIKSLPAEAQNLIDGLPAFKSDKELQYAPLQAADFLAWHLRREHETGEKLARTNGLISHDAHLVQGIPMKCCGVGPAITPRYLACRSFSQSSNGRISRR